MRCLAMDVGSTTIKGAVLDLEERRLGATATRAFPAPLTGLPAGHFEVNPRQIRDTVEAVLSALLQDAPDAERVYLSGQMGGLVLSSERGEPLGNYISWRDQRTLSDAGRGASYLDEIRERLAGPVLAALGNELQPGSTTSLLHWLGRHGQLPAGALPATVADFVLGHLCGVPPSMHETHAIGLLDLGASAWHHEALERLGLGSVRLPQLVRRHAPVGRLAIGGRSLLAFGSYGDQQCALRGAGLERGDLSINISTGSQVSRRTERFIPGPYQSRKYFHGDGLDTVTHLPAGRSLNVLMDLLTELARAEGVSLRDPWGAVVRRAEAVAESSLRVDLAFFAGPLGSEGKIEGITTENLTAGHLFHAAFRAMADNYARCAARLGAPGAWRRIVLSGGLTQTVPLLRRLLHERFPAPLHESAGEETLLGLLDIACSGEA